MKKDGLEIVDNENTHYTGFELMPPHDPILVTSNMKSPLNVENTTRKAKCPPYTRYQGFFARAGVQASTNKIITSYADYGYRQSFGKNSGFKFSLGFNVTDGYSFSQDSIIIHNGVSTNRRFTDRDLDYIVNFQSSLEYIYQINNFSIGFGPRYSYAVLNRISEFSTNEFTFQNTEATSGNNVILNNDWSGMNRNSIEGLVNLSYHKNRFEFGITVTKRLNNLIKSNEAFSRKSNTPLQFGARVSYNFN